MKTDRERLARVLFAAWVNCDPDNIPEAYKGHTCQSTMEAWARVGEAARKHFIPDGYRIVPEVPTEAMVEAGAGNFWGWKDDVRAIYTAMLNAEETRDEG